LDLVDNFLIDGEAVDAAAIIFQTKKPGFWRKSGLGCEISCQKPGFWDKAID